MMCIHGKNYGRKFTLDLSQKAAKRWKEDDIEHLGSLYEFCKNFLLIRLLG